MPRKNQMIGLMELAWNRCSGDINTIIGEAARKPPVLTGGGIASLTFCTYHLYSAVLGYTLRSLLPIRDRQYRYSKMVTTGDHTSKHHAILDVRRTTV